MSQHKALKKVIAASRSEESRSVATTSERLKSTELKIIKIIWN